MYYLDCTISTVYNRSMTSREEFAMKIKKLRWFAAVMVFAVFITASFGACGRRPIYDDPSKTPSAAHNTPESTGTAVDTSLQPPETSQSDNTQEPIPRHTRRVILPTPIMLRQLPRRRPIRRINLPNPVLRRPPLLRRRLLLPALHGSTVLVLCSAIWIMTDRLRGLNLP